MLPTNNEKYLLGLFKRKENSPYEWDNTPDISFKGRPASQKEVKQYRIQQGVNGGTDSVFVFTSNLPKIVKPGDKIVFMGKEWMVKSTGYYFDESRFVNAGLMSDDYIERKCPKGINIE